MKTIIKSSLLLLSLTLIFSSCNESSAKVQAKMVKPKVIDIKEETVIRLDVGEAFMVTQEKKGGRMFAIGNIDGVLSATQVEDGGKTPISVNLTSATQAEVRTQRDEFIVYTDQDGDGLVDLKMDKSGKYKVKSIIWEKIEPSE